jgi:hypothetical protein
MVVPSPQGEGKMAIPTPVQTGATLGSWIAVKSPAVQPGVPVAVKGHNRVYGPEPVETAPGVVEPPPEMQESSKQSTSPAAVTKTGESATQPAS